MTATTRARFDLEPAASKLEESVRKLRLRLLNCCIGKHAGAAATDRKQAVVDAAFSCAFALYWRYQVAHNLKGMGYTLKKHFLTRETFLDVMTITQTRILLVVLYRVWYPHFKSCACGFGADAIGLVNVLPKRDRRLVHGFD